MENGRNSPELLNSLKFYSIEKGATKYNSPEFKLNVHNIEVGNNKRQRKVNFDEALSENNYVNVKNTTRRDKSYSMPLGRESIIERFNSLTKLDKEKKLEKRESVYVNTSKSPMRRLSTISPPTNYLERSGLFNNNLEFELLDSNMKDSLASPIAAMCNQMFTNPDLPVKNDNCYVSTNKVKSNVNEIKNLHSPLKKSHLCNSDIDCNDNKDFINKLSKFKDSKKIDLQNDKSISIEKQEKSEFKEKANLNNSSMFFSRKFINQSNDNITDMSMSRDYSTLTKRQRNKNYKIKTNVTGHKNEQAS